MPWVKGQSPNPGGRPRIVQTVRRQAQNKMEEALAIVLKGMRSEDEKVAIQAAVKVLQIAGVPFTPDTTPEATQPEAQPTREMSEAELYEAATKGEG